MKCINIWCSKFEQFAEGVVFFLLYEIRNCSFFMGIIFRLSLVLVWTFNTRSVYNFITIKTNIPVNLVSFFNYVWFLFCRFLKYGATNKLKSLFLLKDKRAGLFIQNTSKPCSSQKLVWSAYACRTATATFF